MSDTKLPNCDRICAYCDTIWLRTQDGPDCPECGRAGADYDLTKTNSGERDG